MSKIIKIESETHKRLEDLGKKSETYDEIISRLIDFYIKKRGGA